MKRHHHLNRRFKFKKAVLWRCLGAASLVSGAHAGPLPASQGYALYLNADGDSATGCSVSLRKGSGPSTSSGYEYRLQFGVDAQGQTTGPELSACEAGGFASPTAAGSIVATPFTQTVDGGLRDSVVLSIPAALLSNLSQNASVTVSSGGDHFTARLDANQNGNGNGNGPGTGPDASQGEMRPIPALDDRILLLLAAVLLGSAWRFAPRLSRATKVRLAQALMLLVLARLGFGTTQAGASLSLAGPLSQWAGLRPIGTDAAGNHEAGSPDLIALYVVQQQGLLFVRLDSRGNNHPPRISNAPSEVQSLASGAAWKLTLQAQDPDNDLLSWQLLGAPAGVTIDGQGQISAKLDQAGSHSFKARVSDPSGAMPRPASSSRSAPAVAATPVRAAAPAIRQSWGCCPPIRSETCRRWKSPPPCPTSPRNP